MSRHLRGRMLDTVINVIKFLFGWRYNPDLTAEQCEEHYHRVHMELAKKAFTGVDGFIALAYNRVIEHTVNDYNRPERIAPSPTWTPSWSCGSRATRRCRRR